MADSMFYRFMSWYDERWRRKHSVEKIDELISVSYEPYAGERKLMNDGTWIEPGDKLAILHFNRECFSQGGTGARDYARSALRFRRLITASLAHISQRMNDEKFKDVKALHGVSWLPPHGEKLGFMIERLPESWLNRVRKFYFRVLLKAFFPTLAARENNRLHPHAYWMTRNNLSKHLPQELNDDKSPDDKSSDESTRFESSTINTPPKSNKLKPAIASYS